MIDSKSPISFFDPVKNDLDLTLNAIRQNLLSEDPLLNSIIEYILSTGGKHIRPALSLMSSKLFLNDLHQSNIVIAQIAEIIHTATLMHDDVIDNTVLRRSQRTVNDIWGNKISVICGDYFLARASILLASLQNTYIVEIFANVLEEICLGEIQQSRLLFDSSINWESYILKSIRKTGTLFASSMQGGAIVSGATEEQIEAVRNFGLNYGIAFQIVDDILNFYPEKQVGKPSFEDLRSGILTAPVIYAMEEYSELTGLIDTRFEEEDSFNKSLDIIMNSSGLAKSKDLADIYVQKAINSLNIISDSPIKESLKDLAKYVIQREF